MSLSQWHSDFSGWEKEVKSSLGSRGLTCRHKLILLHVPQVNIDYVIGHVVAMVRKLSTSSFNQFRLTSKSKQDNKISKQTKPLRQRN